jgi:hypothetical protein
MTAIPGFVISPCCPYPDPGDASDLRRSRHLTKILDGLDSDEIEQLARDFLLLCPRDSQQTLLYIQNRRRLA